MRPFLVFCVMAVFMALPASARAGDAIKIVNEDGSVTVFEIPKEAVKTAPPPEKRGWSFKRRPEEERLRQEAAPAPVPEEVEFGELADPAEEPPREYAPPKPVETIDWRGEPVRKEKRNEELEPVTAEKFIPVPGRKPVRTPASMARVDEEPDVFPLPQGGVISQNRAVAIAIDRAPPARDFDVFRRMHGDRRVYAVVFRTEAGPYEVLVDAQSGDVVGPPPRRRN